MKVSLRLALAILIIAAPALSSAQKKKTPNPLRDLLSVSDIHFNPYYDPSLVDTLVTSDITKWQGILQSSAQGPNGYNSDPNYALFRSALAAMKQQNPNPSFIIISGDFLCHDFQGSFSKYSSYPDSLHSFTAKTVRFIAYMLDSYFPKTIILPVLGNNDSDCGDYMLQPGGPFLNTFARAFAPLLRNGNAKKDSSFIAQFSKGGYYTYPFPNGVKGKLVMVNSVFFSANYMNNCGDPTATPGAEELTWIDSVMASGTLPAWLVYHIPPGINVHSTAYGYGSCESKIEMMWSADMNAQFLGLVQKHAPKIKAMLAGHTHMDDFRVIYNKGIPVSFIHITPAVSPLFGNNPGFQRISWNSLTLGLQNAETFYLNLGKKASTWIPEYNFQKTYGVVGINGNTLNNVRQKILIDSSYRNRYINLYKVSNPNSTEINQQNWKAFWCGTGALTQQDYSNCWCPKN
jgi:sphingomyelin phosphodiesterase acid-like 3